MRGSIVGLDLVNTYIILSRSVIDIQLQDTSVADLARKYALALESISLQTRHSERWSS